MVVSAETRGWADESRRERAIAATPPFTSWPAAALQRLARAARARRYAAGEVLCRQGARADSVSILVLGSAESSMSSADGRRIVLKLDAPGRAYGLVSMIDRGALTNDMVALEPSITLEISCSAVRAELAADPALWESVARLLNMRSRYYLEQMRSFTLDSLPARAASLLLGLLEPAGRGATGSVAIEFRLTQQRFAEMLGVTRQALTPLLQAMVRDGLLRWHYGRVTLLDAPRLEARAKTIPAIDSRTPRRTRRGERRAG